MPEPLPPASKIADSKPINMYEMEVGGSNFADLQQNQALLYDNSRPDCFNSSLVGCQLNAKSDIGGKDYCINQSIPRQYS